MRRIFLLILVTALFSACGGGNKDGGESPPAPPKREPLPYPDIPPRPPKPENPLGFSEGVISSIHRNLRGIVSQSDWVKRTENEKKILIGAWLFDATDISKPLNWEELSDEQIAYLINLYFDENLYFKQKGI